MAAFKFRLDNLLKIKEQMENLKKGELSESIRRLNNEISLLEEIISEKDRIIAGLYDLTVRGINVNSLREYNNYLSYIKQLEEKQKENIKKEQLNVDKLREELMEITKEKKMLQGLKDKKLQEYKRKVNLDENKIIDELISFRQNSSHTGVTDGIN